MATEPPPNEPARGEDGAPPPEGEGGRRPLPLAAWLGLLRRLARSARSFFAAHLMVAQDEAEAEIARVATGVGLLLGALMFTFATALLLAVAAVVLVQRLSGLPWLESVALAALGTALVAASLGGLSWLRLRRPLMPRTRALLEKTLDGLR